MENSTSIHRFMTLRNAEYGPSDNPDVLIQPSTTFVTSLISINEDTDLSRAQKFEGMNGALQEFIDSPAFLRTREEFEAAKVIQDAAPSADHVKTLYDNVVARILTKSNTTRIFGDLIKQIKYIFSVVNTEDVEELTVLLPERLILTFSGYSAGEPEEEDDDSVQISELSESIVTYTALQTLIEKAKASHVVAFPTLDEVRVVNIEYVPLLDMLGTDEIEVTDAKTIVLNKLTDLNEVASKSRMLRSTEKSDVRVEKSFDEDIRDNIVSVTLEKEAYTRLSALIRKAENEDITLFQRESVIEAGEFEEIAGTIKNGAMTIEEAEAFTSDMLNGLYRDLLALATPRSYTLLGSQWIDVSGLEDLFTGEPIIDEESIMVWANGCYLKFPFFIADLRVIEQLTVGYLPSEIAHINNTQAGETHERTTRRLRKVETTESLITDIEVYRETDTTSTDKLTLEREMTNVLETEIKGSVTSKISQTLGPSYTASVDAGYSGTMTDTLTNKTAMTQAKELVQKVVDKVTNKVRSERTVKTIEEFEETVKHIIENEEGGTKSFVYRWLNKLVRGTLKNYGKRLMFQIDIAHPAHYLLARTISDQPKLLVPPDPRTLKDDVSLPFQVESITRDNYLIWAEKYGVRLDQPPVKEIRVSDSFSSSTSLFTSKLLQIKSGYACKVAYVSDSYGRADGFDQIRVLVGNKGFAYFNGTSHEYGPAVLYLSDETEQLPVSIYQGYHGSIINLEVLCELTSQAYREWQIKSYHAIIEGYEQLKAEAEAKMAEWNPNLPGLNPLKKQELIDTELKKEALRKMFRCNPFWVNDDFVVGTEYEPNCCDDNRYAERVRFLENVFDWDNMTYKLHPYFYSNKNSWSQLLSLSDDDPRFEAFLKASYATVCIPVHRDAQKETAAVNFILNNSIANYDTVPENMQTLLENLDTEPATLFTVDLEGNDIPVPTSTVDLGIFTIPTDLVILECGTQDGIKPIGFPQSADAPTSDVIIPKQYSPAIIADTCSGGTGG